MVAAAVVLYATADILSPPGSPTTENPGADVLGLTEMHSDVKGKGKEVQVFTDGERGRRRSRDEQEISALVTDLSADKDRSRTDEGRRRRRSHHSSRSYRDLESRDRDLGDAHDYRDLSKDGSRHSYSRRHRSESYNSSRSLGADERPRTPPAQDKDSNYPPEHRSPRKQRTPEEQAAHDKRKEERRRLRELERAREEIPASPTSPAKEERVKERSAPRQRSERDLSERDRSDRDRAERSEHRRRRHSHSRASVEFDVPSSSRKTEPVLNSREGVSMPPSASRTFPPELKRSSTGRSSRARRSERSERSERSDDRLARDDDYRPSSREHREHREPRVRRSEDRIVRDEEVPRPRSSKRSTANVLDTKDSAASVGEASISKGAASISSTGEHESASHRAKRQEKREKVRESETKEKGGIRGAFKRLFTRG